jgi:hypothetical protein
MILAFSLLLFAACQAPQKEEKIIEKVDEMILPFKKKRNV